MDKFIKKEIDTTKSAQEKLKKEREERGAKQFTPRLREELLKEAEEVRRIIADNELRQQRDREQRMQSALNDEKAIARLSAEFGEIPSITTKIHKENTTLEHLIGQRNARNNESLYTRLKAIEADLDSGSSHKTAPPHEPGEEVLETSKELLPDIRQETAAKTELPNIETSSTPKTPPSEKATHPKAKDIESAPFPIDRLKWTDEDFKRHHQEMKNIPCIKGREAYREITGTISKLVDYYEQEPGTFWQESVQPFEPKQVIMRYGGEDWAYAFHRQQKYGEETEAQESSVTGIAKKIVKEVPRLVQEYKNRIDNALPEQRLELERELVEKVEHVFSSIYFQEKRSGNVAVEKINGPRGPIYITRDGNHRIAAARLIDLKRVRGIVKEPKNPSISKRFWYELLAMLPPDQSKQLQKLYSDIYRNRTRRRERTSRSSKEVARNTVIARK